MIPLCVFSAIASLLMVSCKEAKITSREEGVDYSNKFSLDDPGDCAVIKKNQDYLLLKLKSRGPESCAQVQWWHQKGDGIFNLEQADTGTINLFEKRKMAYKEGDKTYYKDDGSSLFINVSTMHIEWSSNRYYYLPSDYKYKILNATDQNENISVNDVQWESGNSVKEDSLHTGSKQYLASSGISEGVSLENSVFLAKPGYYLLINRNDEYLLIKLESCLNASAAIKWWYKKTEDQALEFDKLKSKEAELFEKFKVIKEEKDRIEVEDIGSQRRLEVEGIHIEWSSPSYFYLQNDCKYKLFDENLNIEHIALDQIKWEIKKDSGNEGV
jgi:hypothetical protein